MSFLDRVTNDNAGNTVYVTADGDIVDQIARAYYGYHIGNTEAILEANPALAKVRAKLSAGMVISLPDRPKTSPVSSETVELWE